LPAAPIAPPIAASIAAPVAAPVAVPIAAVTTAAIGPRKARRRLRDWACTALLATVGACAWAGPALDRIKARGSMVLAYQTGAPFAMSLRAGQAPVGYSIDLCKHVAEAVRKALDLKAMRIDYLPVGSSERLPTIASGKADIECGSTTNNESRRREVAFTVPHYITGTRFAVRADSHIESLRELAGKKVVSTVGSTPLGTVKRVSDEGLLGIQVIGVGTFEEAIEMVEQGKADGFAMDDVLLYALIAERPQPEKLKVIGKFLTIEPLAMILPKDDPELKKIVDTEMKRLIHSREAHALYHRWFEQPIPPRNKALNIPMNYLLKDFWKYPNDWVPN
jgi:glutamate/aspartate transport system substrate-binding protein